MTTNPIPSQTPELETTEEVLNGFTSHQLWEGESQAMQITEDGKGGYVLHQYFGKRGHRRHRAIILSADDIDYAAKAVKKLEKARIAAIKKNLLLPHYGTLIHSCEYDIGLRLAPDEPLPQEGDTIPMTTTLDRRPCAVRIDKIVEHRLHDDGHHLLTVHGTKTYTDGGR